MMKALLMIMVFYMTEIISRLMNIIVKWPILGKMCMVVFIAGVYLIFLFHFIFDS